MLRNIAISFTPEEFKRIREAVANKNRDKALVILAGLEKIFKEREQAHCEMMISPKIKEDGLDH